MDTKSTPPPSQDEVERRFRALLEQGDIVDLARWLDVPYDTLNKQLNPNNPTNKSDFYRSARLLWGLAQIDEAKARRAIDLISELLFPTEDAIQLASRIENDARRLKEMMSASAR